MRPPHSSEARGSIQWERRDQSLSDLERRDGILLHEEVNADARHRHVLAQSEHQPQASLQKGDNIKVRRAPASTPWKDAGGGGSNHSDRALAVLDLGLEPLQVRDATADVRNVLPAAAELHDED